MYSNCTGYIQMSKSNMWYDGIIASILALKLDIVFIVDPIKLMGFSKIRDILNKYYSRIIEFENELKLRKVLREKSYKILVIFQDKKDIPFDLLSIYATIEVDLNNIFPLLDIGPLCRISFDNYQIIYERYNELKKRYDRLSEMETNKFIENILSSKTIKEEKRAKDLINILNEFLTKTLTDKNIWGAISQIFGELMFLIHENNLNIDIKEIKFKINREFKEFVLKYYEDLMYSANCLIHFNILDLIFENPNQKTALICFDCMGFEEWNVVKRYIENRVNMEFNIRYSFVMLPSETNYSGNALFAGLTPKKIRELDYINKISWRNEERLFNSALNGRLGIEKNQIYFKRCVEPTEIDIHFDSFSDYQVIGLVFSLIDRLTHANLMDKISLIKNLQMHFEKSNILECIQSLLTQGFRVYFISDHGSTHCKGNGIHVNKVMIDTNAKRYLLGPKKELLEEYKTADSEIIQLKNMIGDDYLLLLTGDNMFSGKNDTGLTHGGISLEEMVVPFIEVKQHDRV